VRVVISSGFLANDICASLRTSGTIVLVALVISALLCSSGGGTTLAPLKDIAAQLDRISAGQYDAPAADAKGFAESGDETRTGEFGKITQSRPAIARRARNFQTMRENMNSVMAGLETVCSCSRAMRAP